MAATSVFIPAKYADILNDIGDFESEVAEAVEHYITERIIQRIQKARKVIEKYQHQYGSDCESFSTKMQTSTAHHRRISKKFPLWEQDLLEWSYYEKEYGEWSQKLESILRRY